MVPCTPGKPHAVKCHARGLELRRFRPSSETVNGQCSANAQQIKIVGAQNFQVPKLVAQAQLVVSLELAAMAGATDALKVFAAVGIPSSEFPDEPRRHNVVHMAVDTSLLEIHSAGLYLALPTQC